MRVLKRAIAIVYLATTIVALGTLFCQFWGPYTYRFMLLMRDPMPRIVVTAMRRRRGVWRTAELFPPDVRPSRAVLRASGGERNIEVTLAALSSCARVAAERDDRVMVEHVEARVQGPDDSHVRFKGRGYRA